MTTRNLLSAQNGTDHRVLDVLSESQEPLSQQFVEGLHLQAVTAAMVDDSLSPLKLAANNDMGHNSVGSDYDYLRDPNMLAG